MGALFPASSPKLLFKALLTFQDSHQKFTFKRTIGKKKWPLKLPNPFGLKIVFQLMS